MGYDWKNPLEVDGCDVWLLNVGAGGDAGCPFVVMPSSEDAPKELECMVPELERAVKAGQCRPFRLACFASNDWNLDYSPWRAQALSAKAEPFGGGASQTLAWMKQALMPELARLVGAPLGPHNTAILGYSLAGLFSLWAFYESGLFGSAACCSGSLWFDGWEAYAVSKSAPENSRVYLSLGEKEERARNPRMAQVGDATRRMAGQLQADPNVTETTLVWHTGGHFTDVSDRMAQGLIWLMNK